MKLLFDENLSPRLADALSDLFPGSLHVHECGLGSSPDRAIWEYAKANGFTIVSKDSDFQETSILLGSSPKVIWLRVSNCTSTAAENLLRMAFPIIGRFIDDSRDTFLVLTRRQKVPSEE